LIARLRAEGVKDFWVAISYPDKAHIDFSEEHRMKTTFPTPHFLTYNFATQDPGPSTIRLAYGLNRADFGSSSCYHFGISYTAARVVAVDETIYSEVGQS